MNISAPFALTDSDREHLALSDDEFPLHDWDNLTSIIGTSYDYVPSIRTDTRC